MSKYPGYAITINRGRKRGMLAAERSWERNAEKLRFRPCLIRIGDGQLLRTERATRKLVCRAWWLRQSPF